MPKAITATPDFQIWMKDGAWFSELKFHTARWLDANTFTVTVGDGVYTFKGLGFSKQDASGYPRGGVIQSISYASPEGGLSITGLSNHASAFFNNLGDAAWLQRIVLPENIEIDGGTADDWLLGDWGNDILSGGGGDDHIDGGQGSNRLFGGAGDDVLIGGDPADYVPANVGDDHLDGGKGADRMSGRKGDDTYVVDDRGDRVIEHAGEGVDTVISGVSFSAVGQSIENVTLTGLSAINAYGNDLANILTGNGAANRIDGGKGADTLIGGKGDDLYIVDDTGDRVVEIHGGGRDTVQSSVAFALGDQQIENLTLTGKAGVAATGNGLGNIIVGNAGANVIAGLAGADQLTGGAGADTFVFNRPSDSTVAASDRILDLGAGDVIDLSRIDGDITRKGVQGFDIVDAFTRHAGELTLTWAQGVTALNLDVDGDGRSDMQILLTGDHRGFDDFLFGG